MKIKTIIALVLSAVFFAGTAGGKQPKICRLRVMSYNMLFEHKLPQEPERRWKSRCPNAVRDFQLNKPDIAGTQELQTFQVEEFLKKSGYEWCGVNLSKGGRDDRQSENEAIFFNPARVSLVKEGHIWFSETPNVPGSYSWGMKYPRMCNWGKFKDKASGKEFYVFNSHFYVDGDKEEARTEAAKLLLQNIHTLTQGSSFIVTGDLNATVSSPSICLLLNDGSMKDSRAAVTDPKGPEGSFHGFGQFNPPKAALRIDHIFVSNNIRVDNYRIIDDQLGTGRWESDHLPVCVDLTF